LVFCHYMVHREWIRPSPAQRPRLEAPPKSRSVSVQPVVTPDAVAWPDSPVLTPEQYVANILSNIDEWALSPSPESPAYSPTRPVSTEASTVAKSALEVGTSLYASPQSPIVPTTERLSPLSPKDQPQGSPCPGLELPAEVEEPATAQVAAVVPEFDQMASQAHLADPGPVVLLPDPWAGPPSEVPEQSHSSPKKGYGLNEASS
jgi:hypothetical protein